MTEIAVKGEFIKLEALLKFSGLAALAAWRKRPSATAK
jgi:ribosome-associated protein YbcJ (S4-like RNA binding protein)